MATYNDGLYQDAIVAYIGDIYYSNASYDAKIGRMRALAETIVRRLTKHWNWETKGHGKHWIDLE